MKPLTASAPRVLGWVWVVVAAVLLVDLMVSQTNVDRLVPGAVLLCTVGAVYVLWLRPRVVPMEHGLRLINPLRETRVPWSAFTWADVTDVVRVHAGDEVFRSWPLREIKRQHVRDNLRRAGDFGGSEPDEDPRTMRPMDAVAKQLREEAERRKAASRGSEWSGPTTTWSPDAIAALAGPFVLLLAAALLG